MQFTPENAAKVMAGTKTQTRRRTDQQLYEVGRVYAVCPGRGKPAIGHVFILRLWNERVGDITLADVKAEGFDTPSDFHNSIRALSKLTPADLCVAYELQVVQAIRNGRRRRSGKTVKP